METLKISILNFIIVNLVNKGILHFLITNGLSTDCSTKEFIHRFFGRALHENAECINFQFHNLKFSQERNSVLSFCYNHRHRCERGN